MSKLLHSGVERFVFLGCCLAISTLMYGAIQAAVPLGVVVVVYQTINFHHYIVDALIWKLRRKEVGAKLGLNPTA